MDTNLVVTEQMRGKGVKFERIRRITGYLVGTLDRFNNGKRAEESERVKHNVSMCEANSLIPDETVCEEINQQIAS